MATACVAHPAAAELTYLAEVGPWDVFYASEPDGRSLCGISQFNNGLGFLIKVNNVREAFIHLSKDSWAVPAGAKVHVGFVVDGRPVLDLPILPTDRPTMIEGNLLPEQAAGLIDRFSLGGHMQVRFLTGSEGFWDVPLKGTYRITQHFLRCLSERLQPRQPFDAALPGSSQPF
ncbi:hypothetical protein [Geminicoccus flavidas]|uniref:hypothetical protein n=1 Tax=Geminicoccus flavidas TaxID=2506407 RepID=UPI001358C871|nr:hypothetical protein [Geminicoccus flavidas]